MVITQVSAGRQEGNSTPGSWKQRSYELISKTREEIRNSAKLRETAMQVETDHKSKNVKKT